MKRPLKLAIFLCPALLFCFLACQNAADRGNEESQAVLGRPGVAALTDSIRRFPGEASLYFRRAEWLAQASEPLLASADYGRSWELKPDQQTGYRFAANLSILGRQRQRIRLLRDAVNRFPSDMEFKRLLGETLAQSGHPAEALQLYKDILARDSSNAEAWYESGLIWEQARDTLSAIRCLARAFSVQPVNTYALELAQLYAEARMPQALKLCDQVIRQDSARELVDPFFIKGIYYSNTGQYARSTVFFDSCIARDWKFTDAYIEKGIALFKLKDYDRALRSFRMASQVTNTSPDAYYWAGRCYEMNHQTEEAALNYERALALDKDFAQAREALRRVKG